MRPTISSAAAALAGRSKLGLPVDHAGHRVDGREIHVERPTQPGVLLVVLALIAAVMRDILSPYRKEDADEGMAIVKANGGLDKMHLAYYQDNNPAEKTPWHFWRLEGPGFVWNYRVLPHVHTFVNISSKLVSLLRRGQ